MNGYSYIGIKYNIGDNVYFYDELNKRVVKIKILDVHFKDNKILYLTDYQSVPMEEDILYNNIYNLLLNIKDKPKDISFKFCNLVEYLHTLKSTE